MATRLAAQQGTQGIVVAARVVALRCYRGAGKGRQPIHYDARRVAGRVGLDSGKTDTGSLVRNS